MNIHPLLIGAIFLGTLMVLPLEAQKLDSPKAEKIRPKAKRVEIVETGNQLLEQGRPEILARTEGLASPFFAPMAEPPAPLPVTDTVDEAAPVEEVAPAPVIRQRLPDRVALEAVARNFKPTGSLIMGERKLLNLSSGTMPEGGSFVATIQGEQYTVKVAEVTTSSYTLQIGTASLTQGFDPGLDSRIQVDSPGE